jgi:hypothetical protein
MKIQLEKSSYLNLDSQPLTGATFTNWMKVLKENRFNISWPFIPQAIYVSLMIAALYPLRLKEKRFCKVHCNDVEIPPPIFIIGHWRSGTTFLHYLMGNDPNLAYVSTMETLASNFFITNETFLQNYMKNRLPTKRPMDNLEMNADLPYEDEYALANLNPYSFYHGWYFPKNILSYFKKYVLFDGVDESIVEKWGADYVHFLKKIAYKKPGKRILLKSLVNTAKIKELLKLFPTAQFIHIHRNPYDVYKSTWKLYYSILPLFSFQNVEFEMLDNAILQIYKEMYEKYLAEKSSIPKENFVELKYEDFVKDPLSNLSKLYERLRINGFKDAKSHFQRYIDFHKDYKKDKYEMSQADKAKVAKNWGFTFDAFGYKK